MLDLFRVLKLEYSKYLILFKSGSFCICFDEDSIILNKLFNYKIVELKNNIKIGFPINKIDIISKRLEHLNINYIVIDNINIIKKYESDNNKFTDYNESVFEYISINKRINNIYNKIKSINNIEEKQIILSKIESIL